MKKPIFHGDGGEGSEVHHLQSLYVLVEVCGENCTDAAR